MNIVQWLKDNRTKVMGYATAVVGAAYTGIATLSTVLPPRAMGIVTFILGLIVAAIGHYNTAKLRQEQ